MINDGDLFLIFVLVFLVVSGAIGGCGMAYVMIRLFLARWPPPA